MIVATSGTPCVPMVRIAANEPWLAKAPMDIGALGINFPMICSRADAEKAVRSVRYPPKGERLWGPFHAPLRWGVSMGDYMATADDDMVCIVTIEHVEAVNRIDEIMATPGIDLAVIGPGDLATSINKRGLPMIPEVVELMAARGGRHFQKRRADRRRGAYRGSSQCDDRARLCGARARFRLVAVPARHRGEFCGDRALRSKVGDKPFKLLGVYMLAPASRRPKPAALRKVAATAAIEARNP